MFEYINKLVYQKRFEEYLSLVSKQLILNIVLRFVL
jgi:hypothetical protein